MEVMRFGRLSLLLMIDLLSIRKIQASMIKSEKQFKIFFQTIEYIYKKDQTGNLEVHFKDTLKLIAKLPSDVKYYQMQVGNHNNKLYSETEWGELIHFQTAKDQYISLHELNLKFQGKLELMKKEDNKRKLRY